jgi:hypothetical protein
MPENLYPCLYYIIISPYTTYSGFSFPSEAEARDVATKTNNLTMRQGGHYDLQAENTTNYNSISTDDMVHQSADYENPANLRIYVRKIVGNTCIFVFLPDRSKHIFSFLQDKMKHY